MTVSVVFCVGADNEPHWVQCEDVVALGELDSGIHDDRRREGRWT